jgi:phosphoribosylcarboxyaminoimidazole (NCAIR) mutase
MREFKITTIWHGSTYKDWYDAKDKKDALAQYEKDFDEWVGSQHRSQRTIKVEEIKTK